MAAARLRAYPHERSPWRANRFADLTPRGLGLKSVTVVIMARCYHPSRDGKPATPHLISCCDSILSNPSMSLQSKTCKVQRIGFNADWLIGYSGDPSPSFEVRDRLIEMSNRGRPKKPIDALRYAYRKQLKVDPRSDLSVTIAGFDEIGGIQILSALPPTGTRQTIEVKDHRAEGYCAIGSGADRALYHLNSTYDDRGTLWECLYRVLEAKFVSEQVRSVGKETALLVLGKDVVGEAWWFRVKPDDIDRCRTFWDSKKASVPDDIEDLDLEPLWNT